jgi:hypothetical protein
MNKVYLDNIIIKDIIKENKKIFIGRIAGVELKVAYYVINNILCSKNDIMELENNAGIFITNDKSLHEYSKLLIDSYLNCSLIAEWEKIGKVYSITGIGQEFISNKTPLTRKIDARSLEPYYFNESWMTSLKGKKILIIHPFVKTFMKQINNFKDIYPNREWFEDCKIEFVEPPLTLAGNHNNIDWKEHYNNFIMKLKTVNDFDIALVGAGGYGMLICNYIFKELNKSVIYIGGALQLFFGVIGKRWFENKEVMNIINDNWIRPNKEDKPPNFNNVEKGCYW